LARYPDGLFAERASVQLEAIEERNREGARTADRRAWDAAREADTVAAYQGYLEAFPEGRFAQEARARRTELLRDDEEAEARNAARAAEEALGLNPLTARVVEQRLAALDLDPGQVDGEFDSNTRRALRNYQRDRGLTVTGYMDEPTLVRLLADTLGQALDE
jgi:hypothetical protein